jgi:ribonuclease G
MKKIIIEKSLPYIMAIARDDSGFIQDTYLDFDDERAPVGSVFKGRVVDLFEEQGFGFVSIGLERNAYLPLSKVPQGQSLKKGQELLVQVERTPHLEKGSMVSAIVEYSSPHIILTAYFKGIRLSKDFSDEQHKFLKALLSPLIPKNMGLMVRTSAAIVDPNQLIQALQEICARREYCEKQLFLKSASCVFKAQTGIEKWVAERADVIESLTVVEADRNLLESVSSDVKVKIKVAPPQVTSLIDENQLEGIWAKLMERRVPLANGSEIVIDETEAFCMIDINSERYIHQQKNVDFALTVNLGCCNDIARQIRLRNLSGAILIDFIDMQSKAHRDQVIEAMTQALAEDKDSIRVMGFTALGILELTRRRRRPSLLQIMGDLNTRVVSPAHVVYQIQRELLRIKKHMTTTRIVIHCAENTLDWIKRYKADLEKDFSIPIGVELDLNLPYGYRLTMGGS